MADRPRTTGASRFLTCLCAGFLAASGQAADAQSASAPASPQPSAAASAAATASAPSSGLAESAAPPLPPPPYKPLRYDEDYRWLDAVPGSYTTDATDLLKNIHLGDDWRLSIGGETRGRYEYERNRQLLTLDPADDGYFLHRYFLWFDLRYRELARVFFEGQETLSEGVDLNSAAPIFDDRWDVKQAFFDVRPLGEKTPLTLRGGRQEMAYGRQRLISPLGWANVHRRFDGLKLFWQSPQLDIDGFWVRPVDTSPAQGFDKAFDRPDEDQDFLGLYAAYKAIPNHRFEAYFLSLLRNQPPVNANGVANHAQIYTIGGRAEGKRGDWDYEGEIALQTGMWGEDRVKAWAFAAETGYTLSQIFATPRLWAAVDYASGDGDALDDVHGTFNQLFPLGHAYFGYADLVGRQNIIDPHLGASISPLKNLFFSVEQHFFVLAEDTDALYNAAGGSTRRDRSGGSGRYVGHETDLLMRYALDRHSSVEVGYSRFEGGTFIQESGPERPVDFFYVQYLIRF